MGRMVFKITGPKKSLNCLSSVDFKRSKSTTPLNLRQNIVGMKFETEHIKRSNRQKSALDNFTLSNLPFTHANINFFITPRSHRCIESKGIFKTISKFSSSNKDRPLWCSALRRVLKEWLLRRRALDVGNVTRPFLELWFFAYFPLVSHFGQPK